MFNNKAKVASYAENILMLYLTIQNGRILYCWDVRGFDMDIFRNCIVNSKFRFLGSNLKFYSLKRIQWWYHMILNLEIISSLWKCKHLSWINFEKNCISIWKVAFHVLSFWCNHRIKFGIVISSLDLYQNMILIYFRFLKGKMYIYIYISIQLPLSFNLWLMTFEIINHGG